VMKKPIAAIALLLLLAAPGAAAKIKTWTSHSSADYDKARLRQAVVGSEGTVRLARRLTPVTGIDAAHVWDVVEDAAGNLFVATGDEGKVFQVTSAGDVSVAYSGPDSQILCLTLGGDGAIYAGTGPGGRIVRIAADEAPRVVCTTEENYVWALTVAADGHTLFAGTGPHGRVYKVTPDGKAVVHFRARQEHILSLARGDNDVLFAGTDKDGLVYRIDGGGTARVLFQANQPEVRALVVADGAVYAGTAAPARKRSGGSSGSDASAASAADAESSPIVQVAARRTVDNAKPTATPASLSRERDGDRGHAVPAPSVPTAGENSVYRIAADGAFRELYRDKKLVLGLHRAGGRVLVGTGLDGQLIEVNETTRERTELARLDHGQVHKLLRRRDGSLVIATGDPGKLYTLSSGYAASGTLLSEVLDAKLVSRWGAMSWHTDLPAGTRLSVAVRSGPVADPDDTWSDWSAEQTDPENAPAAAPPARYLQYRVSLATDDPAATPTMHRLTVRYATTNQAPELTALEVPDLDAAPAKEPKRLPLRWKATDPNEDELIYSVFVRKEGWADWVLLDEGLQKPDYDWDTTTTSAGIYRVKLVASDRPDNPESLALTAERVSGPVAVAHESPTVTAKVMTIEGGKAVIVAEATDPMVRLTAASFSLNGRKWESLFPEDGLFDSKKESFRFTTEALRPGTYVLMLRVRDAAGNVGTGDVVFTVK
jgi:hypothetical protein